MKGPTIGVDIAKNVFEVYVEDEAGQVVERRRLSRKKMLPWFANRPRAVVGMEACGGGRPLLGARVGEAGPYGAADCPPVCETMGADEQA